MVQILAKVAINNLKTGMVTLSETLDNSGHTLIRSKEELTEKHITLLKMWGVSEIDVKHSKEEIDLDIMNAEFPPSEVSSAALEADLRFKHFNSESKVSLLLKKHFILSKLKGTIK